jgi:hypothetical protein
MKRKEKLLIGNWEGKVCTVNGKNPDIPDSEIIKFSSDYRTEFTYIGFGNNFEDIIQSGSWSLNENILTIKWDENPEEEPILIKIIELTENSLKWEIEIENEGILSESYEK